MFVIAWTCAGSPPVVAPRAEPALTPSELVEGSSALMSGGSDEPSAEGPLVSPIADAISESGESAEFSAVVAAVELLPPSAEDSASLKLVDPVPVVAPSD